MLRPSSHVPIGQSLPSGGDFPIHAKALSPTLSGPLSGALHSSIPGISASGQVMQLCKEEGDTVPAVEELKV